MKRRNTLLLAVATACTLPRLATVSERWRQGGIMEGTRRRYPLRGEPVGALAPDRGRHDRSRGALERVRCHHYLRAEAQSEGHGKAMKAHPTTPEPTEVEKGRLP